MTDKQQKPTHYKKLHRYIQIFQPQKKRGKKPEVSNKIYSTKCGRFWAIFKVLARFGMAACKAGASGFLLCGFHQQCSVASISQWLLVVGHDGFTHKICHCTANGGCCLQHFVLFYSTFWQGVHCKSTNWSVTAAWKYSKTQL